MAKYPKDQFDDIPHDLERTGAHRAPAKRGRGWFTVLWAALFTAIFIFAGLFGLSLLKGESFLGEPAAETPTPSATPTMDPILDPTTIAPERAITITVLNGTTTIDLEDAAFNALQAKGWPVTTAATASQRDIEETVIYYSNPLDEDVARGVALALGVGEVRESTAFLGAPITVVLGADYVATPAA